MDMRRIVIACVVMSAALGSVASAHDHRPPRATLRLGDEIQEGRRYHADGWSKATDDGYCDISFATGFPKFRKALKHSSGEEIVIRLHKKAMAMEVEVQRWPRVDKNGHAAGTPTPVPWLIRPHAPGGAVRAWDVVVVLPAVDGHAYLGVGAYWGDEDGCTQQPDLGSQYAAWTFHLVGG